ncbi:MAG: cysteine--tRNA ligase [Atribacterota bacterium]
MRFFNTLTQKKETFQPRVAGKVAFYVCGPTVYDLIHVGNARVFVLFDSLRRFLESCGFEVIYVQNFTDIDDKIINRAAEKKMDPQELATQYIDRYFHDIERLGVRRATVHPKATEHIPEIITLIRQLEQNEFTYLLEGDVLFDVTRFPEYGKLSRKCGDELMEGARVEARYQKKSPADFVLWKSAKPGEPFWESPWGKGRPGWHIECSAMSMKYLGPTLDIHAGGSDLIFPHHENEIAQSEAATSQPFVRFWLHNGYVNINQEKMSKSLGNILTVRELVERYDPRVLRLMIFSAHYRNPINIDETVLASCRVFLERIKNLLRNFDFIQNKMQENEKWNEPDDEAGKDVIRWKSAFLSALADDFNTAQALGAFSDFMKWVNGYLAPSRRRWNGRILSDIRAFFELVEGILGIVPFREVTEEDRDVIQLLENREKSRKERNWKEADRFRDAIMQAGYVVEDTPLGPRCYRSETGLEPKEGLSLP